MSTERTPPLLEIRNVTVTYYDKSAARVPLKNFNLTLHSGEIAVVIGDSGAGKSTLLHVVAGFHRPVPQPTGYFGRARASLTARVVNPRMTGEVLIDGEDHTFREPRTRPIGLVMQQFNLYPHMTVRENLSFPLRMRNEPREEWPTKIEDVASRLEITELLDKKPRRLSGGQAQRVAIGKMLLRAPRIALFDEAFSNLDPKLRNDLRGSVLEKFLNRSLHGNGGAAARVEDAKGAESRCVIFVSHDVADAVNADKIPVMEREEDGTETQCQIFPRNGGKSAWADMLDSGKELDIVKLIVSTHGLDKQS